MLSVSRYMTCFNTTDEGTFNLGGGQARHLAWCMSGYNTPRCAYCCTEMSQVYHGVIVVNQGGIAGDHGKATAEQCKLGSPERWGWIVTTEIMAVLGNREAQNVKRPL